MFPRSKASKNQKGLSNCSGLFCPNVYLFQHYTVQAKAETFDNEKGHSAMGKIIQIPSHRKIVDMFKVQYHDVHTDRDGWVCEFPTNNFVKLCLQDGVARANKISLQTGTVLLSGILEEQGNDNVNNDNNTNNDTVLLRCPDTNSESDDDEESEYNMSDS